MTITNLPNGLTVSSGLATDTLTVSDSISYTDFTASDTMSTSGLSFVAGGGTVDISGLGVYVTTSASSMTFNFPESPVDGQWLFICCTDSITTVTLNPGTGQTILSEVGSTSGTQAFWWIYRESNNTWYRMPSTGI